MNKALEKALKRQQEIVSTAKSENRDLTEGEQREFNSLQSVIDELTPSEPSGRSAEGGDTPPATNEPTGEPPASGDRGAAYSPETAANIISMCRSFGVESDDYIKRGLSEDEARREIMDELMKRNKPVGTSVTIVAEEEDKFRSAVTDGILMRSGIQVAKPSEGANRYRGLSIKDIAAECLERAGGNQRDFRHMSQDELFGECMRSFYNPVAAFPSILDDVVQKSYVEGMTKSRTTFDQWCKFGTLPNFKKTTNHEYIMSLSGDLAEIPENGELPAYKPKDVLMPERQLKTYGRQFTMSRQAFIDDDIGLLTTMPKRYAELSQRTQNNIIYSILMNNQKIFDGKTLFAKDRKNTLTTGTDVTMASIEKMIYMIGIQKDEAGNQLALMPDLFIVPFGMGAKLRTILYSPTINTTDNTQAVNPYASMNFTVIEDVTLNSMVEEGTAVPWFMGVKDEILQVDYLNGQKEANIRRSEKPGTLGFVWDIYHDFGISVRHPQAIVRNPGIAITGE